MDLLLIRRLAVLALLLAAAAARADLFSPGDLARPHADLEGLSNCTRCHPAGKQLSGEACLSCHRELAGRVADGRGLHGKLNAEQTQRCQSCHPDHQGREFEMVDWGKAGKKGFDHRRAGWPLAGGHAPLECGKCHQERRIADPLVTAMLAKQPKRKTFLGLPTACAACHFDEHRGQLGEDGRRCEQCHDEKAWKPAPRFDHQDTRYPLTGRHKNNPKATCEECHPRRADEETAPASFPPPVVANSYVTYAPVEHRSCLDCHKDPHEDRFGARCQSCHTVRGWSLVRNAVAEREFHDKTRYPLRGAHTDVPCAPCHAARGRTKKFKGLDFKTCTACHYDSHLGQVSKSAGEPGPRCADCHTVDGFTPSRFDTEQHQRSRFPLEGAHRAVSCGRCHPRRPQLAAKIPAPLRKKLKAQHREQLFSLVSFAPPKKLDRPERCEACHADPHGGQFDRRTGGCAGCHRVASFSELSFDHDRDSRYPLTGKHQTAKCAGCHQPPRPGKPVRYQPLERACASCHADAHAAQFAPAPDKPAECERCHDAADWKKPRFEHAPPFTRYLLEGAHRKVECQGCHFEVPVAPGVATRRYRPLPAACDGCHADFHRGAFERTAMGGGCESCHAASGWREVRFGHDRGGFALKGAHRGVGCVDCHPAGFAAKVPSACAGCHRDPHGGDLGARCEGCHDEASWAGRFTADAHRRGLFPLSGRHASLPCEECHAELRERGFSRPSVPCAGCHLREYERTTLGALDHRRLGFSTECRECHGPWSFARARYPAHDGCFPLSSGQHAALRCADCHTSLSSVSVGACQTRTAACSSCHQHACDRSDAQHSQVPGYQCRDRKCYECHRLPESR